MKEYKNMLKRMFDFKGRARRREFWVVTLINSAITCLLNAVLFGACSLAGDPLCYAMGGSAGFNTSGSLVGTIISIPISLFSIYVFVSMLGITVRRYHDAGVPGWVYPICIIGCCCCGIGAIVHLVICFLPSKEDNQYGSNPKAPENNEYEDASGIIISLVAYAICFILVVGCVTWNVMKCGLKDGIDFSNDLLMKKFQNIDATEEPTEEATDDFVFDDTEATTEAATDDLNIDTNGTDSVGASNGNTARYTIKVSNVNLQVDFDAGCEVTDYDGMVSTARSFDNGTYCDLFFGDSFVDVGETSLMSCSDNYGDLDGYTIVDTQEAKAFSVSGTTGYISYYTYTTPSGVLATGSIYQDIGASTYLRIDFTTDASTDIDAIIDSAVITF